MLVFAMVVLAGLAVVCFAAGGEKGLLTGWLPCLLMLGAMVSVAVAPGTPAALLWFPALLAGAFLAARGRKHRLMSLHRGLSLVAMAGLMLVMVPAPPTRVTASASPPLATTASVGHGQHLSVGSMPAVVIGGILLTLVAVATAIVIAQHRPTASGTSNVGHPEPRQRRIARTGELASMTAATLLMLVHS